MDVDDDGFEYERVKAGKYLVGAMEEVFIICMSVIFLFFASFDDPLLGIPPAVSLIIIISQHHSHYSPFCFFILSYIM